MGHDWGVAVVLHAFRRRMPPKIAWTPAFNRFALASALSGAADAIVAVSLAGSLFFSLSPEASREQVLLYLVINMAPFTLLAPLVGPAIDHFRLGHRWISAILFALRAACAAALAFTLLDLALYFFALALLVGAKAFGVVKQALVPELVDEPDQLVAANSRLARLNVVAGALGGGVGAALLAITGSPTATLALACVTFTAAGAFSLLLPSITPREVLTPSVEYEELHAPTIVATAWAFTAIRASVGFFVFGLAFALRRTSEPTWMYGAAIAAYGAGTYLGNVVAPQLRRRFGEDRLTAGALAALAIVLAFAALGPSRALVLLVSLVLGGVASVARQGFDAMVQTHAPMATRGRSFARFETRFQLGWVAGAVAATAIAIPIRYSLAVLAVLLLPSAWWYVRALRVGQEAHAEDPFDPLEVARRRIDHAVEWHRRDLDRLAVTELAGVVDLARATGVHLTSSAVVRLDALRAAALSTWPLDSREVEWAMTYASSLVGRLAPPPVTPAATPAPAVDVDLDVDLDVDVDVDVDVDGDRVDPPAVAPDQDSAGPSTDDDVTAQCEDRRAIVRTTLDKS
jgi:MFS family permease